MKKVIIDPGHAPGNVNGNKNGYKEYAGMWKLSNFLKTALTRCGIQADLTRTETQDPTLTARGQKAKGYDLFISEHSNAADGSARGVECFYSLRRKNDNAYAGKLSVAVSSLMDNFNRGAKTKIGDGGLDYYGVIRAAAVTDCKHIFLIENGFHDNSFDAAFLVSDANLKAIAETQAKCICAVLGVTYTADNTLSLADRLYDKGYIGDKEYWTDVFDGKIQPNVEYLKKVFENTLKG